MSSQRIIFFRQGWAFDLFNTVFLGFLAFITLFPFYNVLVISFSDFKAYMDNAFLLFPPKIQWDAYQYVFQGTNFMYGLRNTVTVTVIGVAYNMFLTTMLAYGLSKKRLVGRNFFINLIIFTMFFGGGLIPFYLLITQTLHLNNSIWSMILPVGINTFNLLVIKNYFNSIPVEMEESPKLDGANDWQIFIKIMLPLSKPILATFGLFYAVDRWNEWWLAMLFLQDKQLYTLQLVLRELIRNNSDVSNVQLASLIGRPVFSMAIKCAAIIVTMVPIMFVYPFLQKYFTQGIMIGAIKS